MILHCQCSIIIVSLLSPWLQHYMCERLLQEVFPVTHLIWDKYSSKRVFKHCLNISGPKRCQKKDSGLCGSMPQAVLDWGDICRNLAWSCGNGSKPQAAPLKKKNQNKTNRTNKTKQNTSNLKADYVKDYENNQYRMKVVRHPNGRISTESGDMNIVIHQSKFEQQEFKPLCMSWLKECLSVPQLDQKAKHFFPFLT